ncbi:MAG: topoisomerase II [Dermatophilaceae bacterium]|nr:topoisomerase II [Dermatophilaceae bacterium]
MGKASRRPRGERTDRSARPQPAPFVARPFEGLPNETDWVAMREIVPAATATVRFADGKAPEGAPDEVTIATVLPLAWPGLHRENGEVLVGIQSGNASGDTSRDIASAIGLATAADAGSPVTALPVSMADTPRLQDLLDLDAPFEMQLHEGFDFWVADADLDAEGKESLERANESAIPTVKLEAAPSAFWCRIGDRTYVRWVLPFDEDTATSALARLHAAGESHLGEDGRLLGCFRSSGLLIPVWEVDPGSEAGDFEEPVAEMKKRIDAAAASTGALTAAERGARAGLTNRQVTLR